MEIEERMELIRECLMNKDATGVKKLILEEKFSDDNKLWELVTLLGQNVTDENLDKCPGFFEVCERCMNYVVNVGNPKELIMALLEQGDSFNDTATFQTFLRLIQKCVLKLSSKQESSVVWTVECLFDPIKNLELPKDIDLDGEERRVHDLDHSVEKINKYVTAFVDYLAPFADQVSRDNIRDFKGEDAQKQLKCLTEHLLKVLEHPLVYLDLTCNKEDERKIKSDSRICAEQVISLMLKLHPNLHDLVRESLRHNETLERILKRKQRDKIDGEVKISDIYGDDGPVPVLGLGCLAYLIHSEEVGKPKLSCLLTQLGIMGVNLPLVLALLVQGASEERRKGVLLFRTFLGKLDETTVLTYEDLDRPEYFRILDALFDIMIHCPVKDLRQQCVEMVQPYIQLFNHMARHQIFVKLFGTLKHAGALGFCVQLYKKQMEETLDDSKTGTPDSNFFLNLKLKKIVLLMTSLKEGPATDLVENSDRIISVLNFIRFLVLKDPPTVNKSRFWNFYAEIEKNFLGSLQTGLEMSKGHYQLELTGLEDGKKSKKALDDMVEMSVSVAGFNLPKMPRGQKMEIMKQALNTLDLITSLLVRVNELIDQQKKVVRQ